MDVDRVVCSEKVTSDFSTPFHVIMINIFFLAIE